MNEKLNKLLQELEETERIANLDIAGADPRNKVGLETRRREAQMAVEPLRIKAKEAIAGVVAKVFVTGEKTKTEKFMAALQEKNGIAIDGTGIYRKLAVIIDRTVGPHRLFGTHQLLHLMQELSNYARSVSDITFPMPKLDANDYSGGIPTLEHTVALVRKAIRASAGEDVTKLWIENNALEKILATKVTEDLVPVVIYGLDDTEIQKLSGILFPGRPSVVVNLDEFEDNDKLVTLAKTKITKSLNKK